MTAALSIGELLQLHPWPDDLARSPHLEWLWVFDLAVAPTTLWPHVADTSRLNRALGLTEMRFVERDGKRWGSGRYGGVQHEWWEVPWEWHAGHWLTRDRRYTKGFPTAMHCVHRIDPIEVNGAPGSRLYLYFGFVARNALTALPIKLGFPGVGRAYAKVLPELARQLAAIDASKQGAPPLLDERVTLPELTRARIWQLQRKLLEGGLDERATKTLVDWIQTADDQDLYRIQIRERARAFGVAERDLLAVALHATRLGLLTMTWDTICPHCRGVRAEASTLAQVAATGDCPVCEIEFATDREESIEITFHVHPSIREVPTQLFCSAEPSRKDHILVQRTVAAGATMRETVALPDGAYRMRRVGERTRAEMIEIAASGTEVRWHNDDARAHQLVIERPTWSDHALRPGQLLSFHDFRDLFSEQYLGDDIRLAVGEQTILFTDVVGSTAFYARVGDPDAFVAIKRHFDELFAIVAKHRGAVIKTIGDAVMAAFGDPVDAVKAAQAIHDAFAPTRQDTPLRLRVSLNTGPCLAVKLAANADYFGGTVNVAAKLQAHAEAWQVAIAEVTYDAPGVAAYLQGAGGTIERQEYRSKALADVVGVYQWTVYREGA